VDHKYVPRAAFSLWIIGLGIGIIGSRSLHSKLLFTVGLYLVVAATLLLAAYYAIGNSPRKRWIGGTIAVWTALFAVWLVVPALHRTPLLHYGTAIAWLCVLGVLTYILWRIDRDEKLENRSRTSHKGTNHRKP
jgi:phosphatidylserine synthase